MSGEVGHIMPQGNLIYGMDANGAFRPVLVDTSGGLGGTNIETIQTPLIAATAIAASAELISSVLSVAGVKKCLITIDHGRASTAAFGTNGTEYRIEYSAKSAGNDTWTPLVSVLCASTACSSAISAGTAAPAAGTTVITITSGTAFVLGDNVMWANTTSAASIEWAKVVLVTGTATFTILDGLTNAQGSTQVIYNQAEHFPLNLDVSAATRIRAVVNNNASGTTLGIYSRVSIITVK